MAAFFAVVRRLFALELIEEGELGARNVLYLLAKAADPIELSGSGDEGILVLRHGFSDTEKISFGELERAANAVGDCVGNFILLGGWFGTGLCSHI